MPELPEVETVRRGLARIWEGGRVVKVIVRRPDLRVPLPEGFAARLEGRTILSVNRRAKYLLAVLDDGMVLMIHLVMSGRMVIGEREPSLHDHVQILTDGPHPTGRQMVTYGDPRRFGSMTLVPGAGLEDRPPLRDLGPEPLEDTFTAEVLTHRLARRQTPIKTALLDQRVVAGLGNIYVCESLFRAGLAPDRPAGSIQGEAIQRLTLAIREVLTEAVADGGSSLRDHVQTTGEVGRFQQRLAVYGRTGQPCPGCDCGPAGGVVRIVQAGRSTFFCPRRQG
ncbi:MAG: bifunctional DNA-formamidopyrimidine glycosylase/DNA-(apurinic or apyrimidinic site) lyase [Alphaproteobacteria bacterium]